jgi:hypothetical protein
MRFLKRGAVAALAVMAGGGAQAAIITPDTAVANSVFSGGYAAENTINGTGLTGFGATDAHAAYASGTLAFPNGNHWTTGALSSPIGANITWGFNSAVSLSDIYIWNHQSNGGLASNPGYDVTLFDLVLRDAGGSALATFSSIALAPDTATRQTFSFGSTIANVRSATFTVRGTQNPTTPFTGLAEVRFEGTIGSVTPPPPPPPPPPPDVSVVPLPAPALMLLSGLAGLGLIRRRRRAQA